MARLARLSLPGQVHHVLQQGNNQQPIFLDAQDRDIFLSTLASSARAHQVAIHAYVLLDSRYHLLATPATSDGLSLMVQALGRSYVRYFNRRHARSGTLWEGRFRSSILEAQAYLLHAMVGLDLAPVRAGLAVQAQDWPWSSHAHYRGLHVDRLITPHAQYWALGNTPFDRENAYAERVHQGLDDAQWQHMESAARGGWALGSEPFLQALDTQGTTRRLTRARPGRPRKSHAID
ncbi:MAG: transposase [Burkholderiales bacterium]|jgi:putative transposase|nr:transposase [Burkholderiales bacterium]